MAGQIEATNVRLHDPTHKRLKTLKPYDTLTFDEFVNELLDLWEADAGEEIR